MPKGKEFDPESLEARILQAFTVCRDQNVYQLASRIENRHNTVVTTTSVQLALKTLIQRGMVEELTRSYRLVPPKVKRSK